MFLHYGEVELLKHMAESLLSCPRSPVELPEGADIYLNRLRMRLQDIKDSVDIELGRGGIE